MKVIAAAVLSLAVLASGAQAQTRYYIGIVCKLDIDQYFKNIKKIRIRDLRECLAKHDKDLLPRCQDHYKEAR